MIDPRGARRARLPWLAHDQRRLVRALGAALCAAAALAFLILSAPTTLIRVAEAPVSPTVSPPQPSRLPPPAVFRTAERQHGAPVAIATRATRATHVSHVAHVAQVAQFAPVAHVAPMHTQPPAPAPTPASQTLSRATHNRTTLSRPTRSGATPAASIPATQSAPDTAPAPQPSLTARPAESALEAAAHSDIYGYVQSETRFHDIFYGFDARTTLGRSPLSPYLILHYTADTRSGSQGAQIFDDNAAVIDVGVRARIGARGPYAFIEAGEGIGLLEQGSQTDLRYGLAYSAEFGSVAGGHTTADASIAAYSRYANTILYANIAHDFPLKGHLRWVAGANLALDARRDSANNYGELFGGAEYNAGNVKLRLTGAAGEYFPRGANQPARARYTTLRPQVLFGFGF